MSGAFKPNTGGGGGGSGAKRGGGIPTAPSSTTGTQAADGWPGVNPTQLGETPLGAFLSPDPTEMANAWELPANAGTLRLPTGITQKVPFNAQDRTHVSQAVQMIDLYSKLSAIANGKKITFSTAEVNAASQLGGNIARAVQMAGGKGGDKAAGSAITEIGTRLKSVGITPNDLANFEKSKVSPQLANLLQNSGYAVTKNMTLTQMLGETSGPKAQQPLAQVSQGMTIGQYVQGLGNLSKAQLSQLQTSLYNSGFYDTNYYDGSKSLTTGLLDTATITAMRKAMQISLQTNTPLESVIGGSLPIPVPGAPDQLSTTTTPDATATTTGQSNYVPQASSSQLQDPLIKAFESALGRAPSQQELANFTATYNQEQASASKIYQTDVNGNPGLPMTATDLQTGVPYIPSAPTASAAAAADAMNSNPVEYGAHGIDNAFGMLMNLVDRQGTSALNTPGHAPNVTS